MKDSIISIISMVVIVVLLVFAFFYGMEREIKRLEDQNAYYINRCLADKDYYPDFCKHVLEEAKNKNLIKTGR